jgi:hypothetical protein
MITVEKYPRGYPSIAAFISADIDGRIYRRFSYPRNRLLLWYQDQVICLEDELRNLDEADLIKGNNGDAEARQRLISRRYDEKYSKDRKEVLEKLEIAIEKYDDLLLREHEIMSIKKAPPKMHKALFDFMWNGKVDSDGATRKHLLKREYEFLYRTDDFMILGNQDDAWLGSFAESFKYLLPGKIRTMVLASSEDRKKSGSLTNVRFYSNRRIGAFVKGIVCAANTVLLVVPVIILYAMSISEASGWLKISVLLIFVVIFSFLLAALTNASRSEMFAGSAG